ncbi:helix-turn-helix domain-containing protein [Pantoea septica]|uniref:helix-turn-helix transcriptional regulator n=1 Tax=Pantoea septica TaxID=472695 RepID=UPI0036F40D79
MAAKGIDMERMYSCRQVCEILSIGKTTLYRKVKNGEIDKPLRNGCRMSRWPESSIIRYQESLKRNHAA